MQAELAEVEWNMSKTIQPDSDMTEACPHLVDRRFVDIERRVHHVIRDVLPLVRGHAHPGVFIHAPSFPSNLARQKQISQQNRAHHDTQPQQSHGQCRHGEGEAVQPSDKRLEPGTPLHCCPVARGTPMHALFDLLR